MTYMPFKDSNTRKFQEVYKINQTRINMKKILILMLKSLRKIINQFEENNMKNKESTPHTL